MCLLNCKKNDEHWAVSNKNWMVSFERIDLIRTKFGKSVDMDSIVGAIHDGCLLLNQMVFGGCFLSESYQHQLRLDYHLRSFSRVQC